MLRPEFFLLLTWTTFCCVTPPENRSDAQEPRQPAPVAADQETAVPQSADKPTNNPAKPGTPAGKPTEDQIRAWITDLGARRFDDRDRATQSLIAAGSQALAPALEAAYTIDREVALRCIVIMQEIGARGDNEALQAALAGLEKIAQNVASPVVAHQASEAKSTLGSVRQERTIEYLRKLGATITPECEDRWYQTIARRESLYVVEIGTEWRGTEKDLARLRWIADAEQVNFVGPQVQDSWFQYLHGMPKLYSLKVKHANITRQGVDAIVQLEGIWLMRLLYVPIDDADAARLENCRGIQKLVVISRNLTERGIGGLEQRFGQDNVKCPPGGALLGITAQVPIGDRWSISDVIPGSAAEKAGLHVMDRIVKYNGQETPDFDALKDMIDKTAPGETVTVEVERGVETLEKKITLGEWE